MVERKNTPLLPLASCFELQRQVEVFVVFLGCQIAVLLVWTTFADEFAIVDVPFFGAVNFPATQVLAVEQLDCFGWSREGKGCHDEAKSNAVFH